MTGLRLACVVLMGAGLAGCDTELDNDTGSINQATPVVVNSAAGACRCAGYSAQDLEK
ncbi:hypothetical protein [Sphingobium terrigena]|uniref:hypothetical protein n=1 Tax=Sphingobium terrigena TaxID=2304063 RepID=UPI001EF0BFE6|nr:hypothetical protein [Sphingobium terrigena]